MDQTLRQARKEIDWYAVLPAQAAQAVLKTYFQAWRNCWDGRADEPNFKARFRTALSVDIPQGRDLQIKRVHRRWGMVNIPKVGRVRFRWTKDLPVGKHANKENRITGARLVKDGLGWHIAFRIQTLEAKPEPHQGPEVGIDAGVNLPLALSDGTTKTTGGRPAPGRHRRPGQVAEPGREGQTAPPGTAGRAPQVLPQAERAQLQPAAATYDQIKQLRARATRRAIDWQHQTTTASPSTTARSWWKQLNITNMVKSAKGTIDHPGKNVAQKSGLNRSISQEAWGRTVTLLTYKTARNGGTLSRFPPRTPPCAAPPAVSSRPAAGKTRPRSYARTPTADGRQRRLERGPEHLAPVPDRPRAHPGCREGSRQAHPWRQARRRKVGRNLL